MADRHIAHITCVPLSYWVSLIKHMFTDKIANNFKMSIKPNMGPSEPHTNGPD